jgi:hypothetical protein
MWSSVQNSITSAGDNPIGAVNSGMDAALGPSFDYLSTIRSPADQGVSSDGTFSQVFTNANAISGYVNSLLTGPKVGNQFFRDTGGKCRAPGGKIVNRWTWNNNKLGGDDAAGVLGDSFKKAVSGSGFDGIIPGAAGDIASMNPLKVMNAIVLDGVPDCQAYECPVTDQLTGIDKGQEVHFMTPSLEFNMTGCRKIENSTAIEKAAEAEAELMDAKTKSEQAEFERRTKCSHEPGKSWETCALPSEEESFTPFFTSPYAPRKLVNNDTGPYIMLGAAVAALVLLGAFRIK